MDVHEVMTRLLVTASPSDTVSQALRRLETEEFRHLPVVESGRLVGMVSDRDLREVRLPLIEAIDNPAMAARLLATPLSDVMETSVVTVGLEDSIEDVIECMLEHRVGALPVIEHHGGSLVGIVSYIDLLAAMRSRPRVGLVG